MAPATLDAERIPGRYSVPAAIMCSLEVLAGVIWANSVVARAIWGAIFATFAVVMYWHFRRQFRKTLTSRLPLRGLKGWLLTLPSGLMILACLASALAALGLTAGVVAMLHDRPAALVLAGFPVVTVAAWADAAAWLELRRWQDSVGGNSADR